MRRMISLMDKVKANDSFALEFLNGYKIGSKRKSSYIGLV